MISPYHLVWNDDYYYVVGYSEKREKIVTFRVDRIASQPDILLADTVPVPEDFDIAEFTKQVFYMYDREEVLVDLRCDNGLMKTMVDRFGEDIWIWRQSSDTCTRECKRTVQENDCVGE